MPNNLNGLDVYHIFDQSAPYTEGIRKEKLTSSTTPSLDSLAGKTILAFYSSCKNKPHRFQFIYSANGYGKNSDGTYKISRKDDRVINQANCQYYIDFSNPDANYLNPNSGNGSDELDLYLPTGFSLGVYAYKDGDSSDKDSYLSSWYRGKRYGFAQQSIYVPLLEKYCQKFKKNNTQIILTPGSNIALH
jgi:hypothetical protein